MKANSRYNAIVLLLSFLMLITAGIKAYGEHNVQEVDYKKWSRLAITSVKDNYPSAEIADFQYVKRVEVNDEETKDVFGMQLNENGKQLNVQVDVIFNPKTAKLITVNIEEIQDAATGGTIILD